MISDNIDTFLAPEIKKPMHELITAKDDAFSLNDKAEVLWQQTSIAKLCAGPTVLQPGLELLVEPAEEQIKQRLAAWVQMQMAERLKPLLLLRDKIDTGALDPATMVLGVRLLAALGAIDRRQIAKELKELSQEQRAGLRDCGVRFGEFSLFMPHLLRPAAARLLALLLAFGPKGNGKPFFAPPGLTSFAVDGEHLTAVLSAVGLRKCGNRLIRLDMLEGVGVEIRNAKQQAGQTSFQPTLEMVALLGCSKPDLALILTSLGYQRHETVTMEADEIDELASSWVNRPPKTKTAKSAKPAVKRKPKPPNHKTSPTNQKKIDPDSPFAVLQSLKQNDGVAIAPKSRTKHV